MVRNYIKKVIEFEQDSGFDCTRTVKLVLGAKIKFSEIKKNFEDFDVDWSKVKYFYSVFFQRIHNVYLTFRNHTEAKRAYD